MRNKYKNKETGEIVKAELRISEKDNWNFYHVELYISAFRKIFFTSLKSLEREWEELTTNK